MKQIHGVRGSAHTVDLATDSWEDGALAHGVLRQSQLRCIGGLGLCVTDGVDFGRAFIGI